MSKLTLNTSTASSLTWTNQKIINNQKIDGMEEDEESRSVQQGMTCNGIILKTKNKAKQNKKKGLSWNAEWFFSKKCWLCAINNRNRLLCDLRYERIYRYTMVLTRLYLFLGSLKRNSLYCHISYHVYPILTTWKTFVLCNKRREIGLTAVILVGMSDQRQRGEGEICPSFRNVSFLYVSHFNVSPICGFISALVLTEEEE